MEQKEVRIPIVGVIEESNGFVDDRMYADHYPNGDGMYLVKFNDGSQELRSVLASEKIKEGRQKIRIEYSFPILFQTIVEEIKKEHESSLKDTIEALRTDVLRAVDACREDIYKENDTIVRTLDELKESGLASGNGISEKTLLEALKVVAGKHI